MDLHSKSCQYRVLQEKIKNMTTPATNLIRYQNNIALIR